MSSQAFQNLVDSIIRIADPDIKTMYFAIAMVNIALCAQIREIDYQNTYRKSLVDLEEVLDLYLSTLEITQDDD